MMISCQHCGNGVANDARACPSCGGKPCQRMSPLAVVGYLILVLGLGAFTGDRGLACVMIAAMILGGAYQRYGLWRQSVAYKNRAAARAVADSQ